MTHPLTHTFHIPTTTTVWNHNFYWNCMKQGGGGVPQGKILDLIVRDFGDFDKFKVRFWCLLFGWSRR